MNTYHSKLSTKASHTNGRYFAELGLPNLLKVGNKGAFNEGKVRGTRNWQRLAQRLPKLEAQLCKWEDANPALYQSMPWYEARELFKAQKARDEVEWPTWWELAGAVDEAGGMLKAAGTGIRQLNYGEWRQAEGRRKTRERKGQ